MVPEPGEGRLPRSQNPPRSMHTSTARPSSANPDQAANFDCNYPALVSFRFQLHSGSGVGSTALFCDGMAAESTWHTRGSHLGHPQPSAPDSRETSTEGELPWSFNTPISQRSLGRKPSFHAATPDNPSGYASQRLRSALLVPEQYRPPLHRSAIRGSSQTSEQERGNPHEAITQPLRIFTTERPSTVTACRQRALISGLRSSRPFRFQVSTGRQLICCAFIGHPELLIKRGEGAIMAPLLRPDCE